MSSAQERIQKMYLRINGEVTDSEMSPPPSPKSKTLTFELNENQVKKLEEWQEHIKAIFGRYGDYEYRFSSNGIGQIVTVYSILADVELDLTDIDSW
jgi:hypothetical protein